MTQCLTWTCWTTVSWSGNGSCSIWAIRQFAGPAKACNLACNTPTERTVHLECGSIQNHRAIFQFAASLRSCSQVNIYKVRNEKRLRMWLSMLLYIHVHDCTNNDSIMIVWWCMPWRMLSLWSKIMYNRVYRIDVTHTTLCGLQSGLITMEHTHILLHNGIFIFIPASRWQLV